MDADDTIAPNRLEILINTAQKENCDIVCDNLIYIPQNSKDGRPYIPLNSDIFGTVNFADYISRHSRRHPTPNPGFLKPFIRRSLIEDHNIRYQEDVPVGEDSLLIYDLLIENAKMYITPDTLYTYYKYEDSLSATFSPEKIKTLYGAYERFLNTHSDKKSNEISQNIAAQIKELRSVEKIEIYRNNPSVKSLIQMATDIMSLQLFLQMAIAKIKRKLKM